MQKIIIYQKDEGNIALIHPVLNCGLSIDSIAKKDVPTGKPYLIIDSMNVPNDYTFFDAFEADFSSPDGYGADYGVGSKNVVIGWLQNGEPITEFRNE